jgi:hypothetical protein
MPDTDPVVVRNERVSIVVAEVDHAQAAPPDLIVRDNGEAALAVQQTGEPVRGGRVDAWGGGDPGLNLGLTAGATWHTAISA